jgi:hypothetical protein
MPLTNVPFAEPRASTSSASRVRSTRACTLDTSAVSATMLLAGDRPKVTSPGAISYRVGSPPSRTSAARTMPLTFTGADDCTELEEDEVELLAQGDHVEVLQATNQPVGPLGQAPTTTPVERGEDYDEEHVGVEELTERLDHLTTRGSAREADSEGGGRRTQRRPAAGGLRASNCASLGAACRAGLPRRRERRVPSPRLNTRTREPGNG